LENKQDGVLDKNKTLFNGLDFVIASPFQVLGRMPGPKREDYQEAGSSFIMRTGYVAPVVEMIV
jgi:hypothetical protein